MCNQDAKLSQCLTKVQESMVAQLKDLHTEKGKGKSFVRSQHAVDELLHLVTFNRRTIQAMARTMQDLSEGIFVNIANLTLACRDSYLELNLHSLFPDQLLVKIEEKMSRNEERCSSTGALQKKLNRYHLYASSPAKLSHQLDQKSSVPA